MVKKIVRKITSYDRRPAVRLRKRLEEVTPIQRMMIFGSRARGDADSDSDMDVFLEVPVLNAALRRKVSEIAWEVGLQYGLVISMFVVTTQAIHSSPLAANPIFKAINTEGIVI